MLLDIQSFIDIDKALLSLFNGSNSVFIDSLALTLTNGYTWIPFYLGFAYLIIKNNEKAGQIFLTIMAAVVCVLITDGLSDGLVKPHVARLRPSVDPSMAGIVSLVHGYTGNGYSFFSAHAANLSGLSVFFSLLIRRRTITITLAAWTLIGCWTRLYLGVHYPSDVLVGLFVGCLTGLLVYVCYLKMYYRISQRFHFISSQYTSTGYSLCDLDVFMTIVVLVGAYVVLRSILSVSILY